jgi:hypothetical protein
MPLTARRPRAGTLGRDRARGRRLDAIAVESSAATITPVTPVLDAALTPNESVTIVGLRRAITAG